MKTKDTQLSDDLGGISRRGLLKSAAALVAAGAVAGPRTARAWGGPIFAYVGSYTGAPGSGGNGQGIYLCALDPSTGALTGVRVVAPALPGTGTTPSTASPSSIALDPTGTRLYAGNEYGPPGAVSAYSIDPLTGDLTLLNVQPAVGAPAYVSVDHNGQYLFSAEYSGSYFEVFPILANGSLGPAVFQMKTLGNVGPRNPTNAPPGSFAISAHEGPNGHPHQMAVDPSNQWVLGTDVGQDRIYVWKLTPGGAPPLTPAAIPFVNTPPGDGPRHFAFHPNGTWVYSLQEEASTLMFWAFDPTSGSLTQRQLLPSLPPGFAGTNFASEVMVSSDGNFLYAANRLLDTIDVFRILTTGELRHVSEVSTRGDYPRSFNIDPTGSFLVSCNQRSDSITSFFLEDGGRNLNFSRQFTPVGSPSSIVFLAPS